MIISDLATPRYTRGRRTLGIEDFDFQILEQQGFPLPPARRNRRTRSASTPPVEDRVPENNTPQGQSNPNIHALIITGVSVPLQKIFPRMATPLPWG